MASVANAARNEPVAEYTMPTTSGTVTDPSCQKAFTAPAAEPATLSPASKGVIAAVRGA